MKKAARNKKKEKKKDKEREKDTNGNQKDSVLIQPQAQLQPTSPPRLGSTTSKPAVKNFAFRFSPKRLKKKIIKGNSNSGNKAKAKSKTKSLTNQETVLSPPRGSLFDLADHKVKVNNLSVNVDEKSSDILYGITTTTSNSSSSSRKIHGSNPFDDSHDDTLNTSDDSIDPIAAKFQTLAETKIMDSPQKSSPTQPPSSSLLHADNNVNNNARASMIQTSSSDEVHFLNKKKREEYFSAQREKQLRGSGRAGGVVGRAPSPIASALVEYSPANATPNVTIGANSSSEYTNYSLSSISASGGSSLVSTSLTKTKLQNKYRSSTPPLLLPPRLESKGSSSCYSFSATSSLDQDNFSLGNSIPYIWSPLSDDLPRTATDDDGGRNDKQGSGSPKDEDNDDNKNDDEIDDDLSIEDEDEGLSIDEEDQNDKGSIEIGNSSQEEQGEKEKKSQDFPQDPFAELKDQGGQRVLTNATPVIQEDGEEDEDNNDEVEIDDDGDDKNESGENDRNSEVKVKRLLFTNELDQTKPSDIHIPVVSSLVSPPLHQNDMKSIKSHPGSIHIKKGMDNASINSSIGESIELLTNINILSMADFLKLDEAQRVQAYRSLADTAAETVTEIDEKRTEIFSMGRQVDELSRRVTDLIKGKVESHRKIKAAEEEIKNLKVIVEGDDKVSALVAELEAKNVIIDALKDSIDKSTLPPATISELEAKGDGIGNEDKMQQKTSLNEDSILQLNENKEISDDGNQGKSPSEVSNRSFKVANLRLKSFVKEKVEEFERVGFAEKLKDMKNDRIEKEMLSGRVKDLVIELEAKDNIIDELKVSLKKQASYEALGQSQEANVSVDLPDSSSSVQRADKSDVQLNEESQSQKENLKGDESQVLEDLRRQIREKDESLKNITDKLNELEKERESMIERNELQRSNSEVSKSNSIKKEKISDRAKELMSVLNDKETFIDELKVSLDQSASIDLSSGPEDSGIEDTTYVQKEGKTSQQHSNEEKKSEYSAAKDSSEVKSAIISHPDQHSIAALRKEIREKNEAIQRMTKEINSLKETLRTNELIKSKLNSLHEKALLEKMDTLDRVSTENSILTEKVKDLEAKDEESVKSSARIKELEQENAEKDKLVGQIAEHEKLVEKVKQLEIECLEKEKLSNRVKELEIEIGDVSGLLEETFRSVKEGNNSQTTTQPKLPAENGKNTGRGPGLFRMSPRRASSANEFSNQEKQQLERICKIHQQTVLRQRAEVNKLQEILNEKDTQLNELRIQATENEEKITALESQFVELNQAKEDKNKTETVALDDSAEEIAGSIIKIDKAYIASLEDKATKDSDAIEELENQITVLQSRNDKLKEKIGLEDKLRHEIQDLTTKLEARELIISGLEKSYNESRTNTKTENDAASSGDEDKGAESSSSSSSSKIDLEHDRKGSILDLNKISLLQQLQNASIGRLHTLVQKLGENSSSEDGSSSASQKPPSIEEDNHRRNLCIIVSLSDKLTLLHDYLKVSIHLLECKLSNDLESMNSVGSGSGGGSTNGTSSHETDEAMNARFDQTKESLKEVEEEMRQNLISFGAEIQHHNIKTSAKDNVIEDLLKTDKRLTEKVEKLQSELDVFKSLSTYSSVNVGVMTRFQECYKLEQELEEKDVEIKRLSSIIAEASSPSPSQSETCETSSSEKNSLDHVIEEE